MKRYEDCVGLMFKPICIDASVLLSLFLNEPSADSVLKFLKTSEKKSIPLVEPTYLAIEVFSTIRNKEFSGDMTSYQAKMILKKFESFKMKSFSVSTDLLGHAYRHASKCNQPVIYDCIYSALAEEQKALFVTADDKFLKKIRHIYPKSYSVVEAIGQIRN